MTVWHLSCLQIVHTLPFFPFNFIPKLQFFFPKNGGHQKLVPWRCVSLQTTLIIAVIQKHSKCGQHFRSLQRFSQIWHRWRFVQKFPLKLPTCKSEIWTKVCHSWRWLSSFGRNQINRKSNWETKDDRKEIKLTRLPFLGNLFVWPMIWATFRQCQASPLVIYQSNLLE